MSTRSIGNKFIQDIAGTKGLVDALKSHRGSIRM